MKYAHWSNFMYQSKSYLVLIALGISSSSISSSSLTIASSSGSASGIYTVFFRCQGYNHIGTQFTGSNICILLKKDVIAILLCLKVQIRWLKDLIEDTSLLIDFVSLQYVYIIFVPDLLLQSCFGYDFECVLALDCISLYSFSV